jgi:hypothetical protein
MKELKQNFRNKIVARMLLENSLNNSFFMDIENENNNGDFEVIDGDDSMILD